MQHTKELLFFTPSSYRTDDLFLGLSSKQVFRTVPGERRTYTLDQTLYIYANFHLRPFLQQLVQEAGQRRILIWIAAGNTLKRKLPLSTN